MPPAWAAAVRAADLPGVVDIVPAARTVLVSCPDRVAVAVLDVAAGRARNVRRAVGRPLATQPRGDRDPRHVRRRGSRRRGTCDRSSIATRSSRATPARRSRVDFCGFAPGSRTSDGLDEVLWLPRRSTPRTRVPAGSVAIANVHSAVYPGVSPGGWHLLGTTSTRVWDADRDPPALLEPGTEVRFVAT